MNRANVPTVVMALGVPHSRGDEPPVYLYAVGGAVCSPLAWG